MKIDVVVCYYRQFRFWEAVAWGLIQNKEHISRVIVVNDEPWEDQPARMAGVLPMPASFLEHKHDGFGLSRSANQGLAAVEGDYALLLEGDEVLPPGSLEATLKGVHPGHLLCCRKVYINEDWKPGSDPTFLEGDHRVDYLTRRWSLRPWVFCSGGHLLIHLPTHHEIGGFCEDYQYGLHDYDYAARWAYHVGMDSVLFGGGLIWHLGSGRGRKTPGVEANHRLIQTLAPLYNHRYHLACGEKFDETSVNLDIQITPAADAYADCKDLSFIPDGSAQSIAHSHFLEHFSVKEALDHLEEVHRKLIHGGEFIIECPDVEKLCKAYLEGKRDAALQGFYSDPAKSHLPGWQHLWGWDVNRLRATLKRKGFRIAYAGDSPSKTCGWRDLRIEAIKP